jgi:hypothetical protein
LKDEVDRHRTGARIVGGSLIPRGGVGCRVVGAGRRWRPGARPGHVLVTIGTFFSKLAVVSFGGAYACSPTWRSRRSRPITG